MAPKYKCQSCDRIFYGWAKQDICSYCGGKLQEVSSNNEVEAKVILMLGTYFDGEAPSNYAIAKLTGMDKRTVSEAVEGLKKKGIK